MPEVRAHDAFREVFEAHVDYVWRVLRHLGVRDRDLDDVVQEVFVVVHRRLAEWEPRASMRSWLYAICLNAARDHARRAHVRRERPSEHIPEIPSARSPDGDAEARQALRRVEDVVAALDERLRVVFLLYEIEGMSMDEIASSLSIPNKTAYSRLRLAREQLRASLSAHLEVAHG